MTTPHLKNLIWTLLLFLVFGGSIAVSDAFAMEFKTLKEQSTVWAPKEPEETITFLFTGDIMLGRYIQVLRERNGEPFPFTYMPEVIDAVEASLEVDEIDLVLGNVEGPISTSDYVNPGTAMIFNFKPETAELLARVGFNAVSIANNHSLDQGRDHFEESHQFLSDAGILAFGHPDTFEGEWTFVTKEFATKTIGFIGLNHTLHNKIDWEKLNEKIREWDAQVDFLIVGIHWGFEYEPTARDTVVEAAHGMVDNGVDFIWGHHPHVIQNREVYKGAPIYYSLGNFVFDQYFSKEVKEGLVVGLKLQGDEVVTSEVMVDLVNLGEPRPRK